MAVDDVTYGEGYSSSDSPFELDDSGRPVVVGYGPGPPPSQGSTAGIGIPNPPEPAPSEPTIQDMPYTPLIPKVAPPTAMFDSVSYEGYKVQFINESLGNIEGILWSFGDGSTSTEEHPIYTYGVSGTYDVQLWISNEGGDDYYIKSVVTVDPAPVVDFNFAIGGYTAYFTNLSNSPDSLWDFGDGQTSSDRNPKHVYATTGDYTVTLKTGGLTLQKEVKIDVEVLLEWSDNSEGETGFKIEHSLTGEAESWTQIATVGADIETYGVTKAKDGVDSAAVNFFRVRAYSSGGDSDYSNEANVRC